MQIPAPPDALMLMSGHCPHCPALLAGLSELLKRGGIGRLEVVNIEVHGEVAASLGVRGVPWVRLGPFELVGALSSGELAVWARRAMSPEGMADAFHDLLKTGGALQVLRLVRDEPGRLAGLLPIVANPDASLNVRLGAGMVFEAFAASPELRALVPALCDLLRHDDARVRADAAHVLGLSRDAAARPCLEPLLGDADADVREIAADSLAGL
ncbi:MAG: HEAT repeat domain-containing protein [Thiobacillaceae bacterium]|nr:HEAT repeat domain-containing protein [Thiobacillaceae bacterium]